MKTEMRNDEVFKKWCFDTKLVINKNWFNLENPSGDEVYVAWLAWQASASREGYKLVPVETLQESLGWARIAEWDSPNKETDEEIRKHKSVIEKAIMGAGE